MRSAVLLIDLLEDFFVDGHLAEIRSTLTSKINRLIRMARAAEIPLIWVRQEFDDDLHDAFLIMRKHNIRITIKGTFGVRLLSELDRQSTDFEIVKQRYSAFYRTDLDSLLQRLGVDTLIVCGINTHACVRTAVIDAYQRDYEVMIVRECVASPDQEHHRVSLDYLGEEISRVLSLSEIASIIGGGI